MLPKYSRVLLKLSGEALMGDKNFGFDNAMIAQYALAKLWLAWGIRPFAIHGTGSGGEVTALLQSHIPSSQAKTAPPREPSMVARRARRAERKASRARKSAH